MSRHQLPISGAYPSDWDAIGDRVRAEAGHRCIRCGHRYKIGEGKGQWSQCDEHCRHSGPLAVMIDDGPAGLSRMIDDDESAQDVRAKGWPVFAEWRILTVHHFDGDKSNCEWWNLLALCQRCHLTIQSRVIPGTPYFLEHSEWIRPYVAGFYAKKYEGRNITREEAMARMDELLKYERIA